MLNFRCVHCDEEIQSEYQYIGEMVECPICQTLQIVPDPILPHGSEYHGYRISRIMASSLLWTSYKARGISELPGQDVLLRIPTHFFLKRVSDFDSFADTVIKTGSLNMPEFPSLLDRSTAPNKVYFAFEFISNAYSLERFAQSAQALAPAYALLICSNMAKALHRAWEKEQIIHQNIIPGNIRICNDWSVRIRNIGLSQFLLQDHTLLDHGFNIWDYRYMSPEFLLAGKADSPSADIYALGGILFLLTTGHHPYEDVESEDIQSLPIPDPRELNPNCPEEIAYLVQHCMAADPAERPADWNELIDKLSRTMTSQSESSGATDIIKQYRLHGVRTGRYEPTGLSPHGHRKKLLIKKTASVSDTAESMPRQKRAQTDTVARLAKVDLPVRTINRRWAGKSSHKQMSKNRESAVIFWLVVGLTALLVVGIVFAAVLISGTAKKVSPPTLAIEDDRGADAAAGAPAVNQPSAPSVDRASDAGNGKGEKKLSPAAEIEDQLKQIALFFDSNPGAFDEVIARYEELIPRAVAINRFDLIDKIRDKTDAIEKAKQSRVQTVTATLSKQAGILVQKGEYEAAVNLLENYDGEFAHESKAPRLRIAQEYRKSMQERLDRKSTMIEKLQEAMAKTAPSLLRGKTSETEVFLSIAIKLPEYAETHRELEKLRSQIDIFNSVRQNNEFVTNDSDAESPLLNGLLHTANRNFPAARLAFQQIPLDLGKSLLPELELMEIESQFQDILKSSGFSFSRENPEATMLELTQKKLSPAEAEKLSRKLNEFNQKNADSEFLAKHRNVLLAVLTYCSRISGDKPAAPGQDQKNFSIKNDSQPSPGEAFARILREAPNGSEIRLHEAVYNIGRIKIIQNNLRIAGMPGVIIEGTLEIESSELSIEDLYFRKGRVVTGKGCRKMSAKNLRFENDEVILGHGTADIKFENCLFRGVNIIRAENLSFNHCTFLTPKRGIEAAIQIDTVKPLSIRNSIIHGRQYGIIFKQRDGDRDREIEYCLWFGELGLAAYQEGNSRIEGKNILERRTQLRRYCRPKNNIYEPPQFANPLQDDWSLVPKVPGTKAAENNQDCGVIWQ